MSPRAGLDGRKISSPPGFDPEPSSSLSVAIPTDLPGQTYIYIYLFIYLYLYTYIYIYMYIFYEVWTENGQRRHANSGAFITFTYDVTQITVMRRITTFPLTTVFP